MITNIIPLVLKLVTEHIAEKGKPTKHDIISAKSETLRDKITISNKSEFNDNISFKELKSIVLKSCKMDNH
tara:strand:- start:8025 stop:8237 length:213 start_codon:yes stop_codon:yes gene_type:complete